MNPAGTPKGSELRNLCFPKDAQKRAGKLGRRAPWALSRTNRPCCQEETCRAGAIFPTRFQAGSDFLKGTRRLRHANRVEGSTFTPGPMVDEMATRLMKWPLAPGGFAFCTASAKALMFSTSFWASNEDLPTPA